MKTKNSKKISNHQLNINKDRKIVKTTLYKAKL